MQDRGADARLAVVIDLINEMEIPEWRLQVEYLGSPDTPPPVKDLRKELECWLAAIGIKAIDTASKHKHGTMSRNSSDKATDCTPFPKSRGSSKP